MRKNCRTTMPSMPGRRSFIRLGGVGFATLFMGGPFFEKTARAASSPARRLVVLEMNGGNDGLNTVIPYGKGEYYDRRQRLAIQASKVLPLDSTWGLHPSLPVLKQRYQAGEVAIFRGVGHSSPDLSHFAMMDYWRAGHPEGSVSTGQTGWLGRLLDTLGDLPGSLAGLSLSSSVGPALLGRRDLSAAASSKEAGQLYVPNNLDQTFRTALQGMSALDDMASPVLKAARKGIEGGLALSDFLNQLETPSPSFPQTYTGYLLALAAKIIQFNEWIRILHVPLPLDFDTHVNQPSVQASNLLEINNALDAFLKELEANNLAEQTLVVTTSEFGRRMEDNGGYGTDHGTANSLFVIGKKIKAGFYGDPPSLSQLDKDGNLIATMSFQDFLATVSEGWMGAPASEVVPGGRVVSMFK